MKHAPWQSQCFNLMRCSLACCHCVMTTPDILIVKTIKTLCPLLQKPEEDIINTGHHGLLGFWRWGIEIFTVRERESASCVCVCVKRESDIERDELDPLVWQGDSLGIKQEKEWNTLTNSQTTKFQHTRLHKIHGYEMLKIIMLDALTVILAKCAFSSRRIEVGAVHVWVGTACSRHVSRSEVRGQGSKMLLGQNWVYDAC